MTICVAVKVHDGLVLASDSATTLVDGAQQIQTVYNNANKIFNLHRSLPIGLATWGLGSIGPASIATLAKDLRQRFMGDDPDWRIDVADYSLEEVAGKVRQYFCDELYFPQFSGVDAADQPDLGFFVGGYSSPNALAELYQIDVSGGTCDAPRLVGGLNETSIYAQGQPEAVIRLVVGLPGNISTVLEEVGADPGDVPAMLDYMAGRSRASLVQSAMPIQDAIDLAEFLVETTIKFSRFTVDWATCGGPIEVAAITKHEGFKWTKRKLYFDTKLNPQTA